ncbi:MAG: hypothetical protein H6Q38_601 [Chloroflexi bacterium]|nr:hypothetical protein [Chloroflexota bacterium]
MTENNEIEYHLKLHTLDELFAEPLADPWDPTSRYVSGLDEVANYLHLQRLRYQTVHLTISLDAEGVNDDLRRKTIEAIKRYCDYQIAENTRQIAEVRLEGRRSLVTSIPVLLIIIGIGVLIFLIPYLTDTVKSYLAAGLGVFTWVTLWNPADLLIYAWRPLLHDKHMYEKIRDGEIVLKSSQADSPHQE